MSWDKINDASSREAKEAASKAQAERKEAVVALSKRYARCFSTEDGRAVLADLTNNLIINNNTPMDAVNINYMAAYKNGEKGVVNMIIHQITTAGVI